MDLFIIRHGQSVGNISEEDMPDCPLTELGRRQAEHVADCLEGAGLTHIVSSPLIRAIETAQPLARRSELPVRVWLEAYEIRNRGPYRGPKSEELERLFAGILLEDEMDAEGWFYAGDETPERGHERAQRFIGRLRREFPGDERVALFAHGGFNRYLLRAAIGLDHNSGVRFAESNGSIYWISFKERETVVEYAGLPRPLFG
ncbi:histidine phosphatase family protein [Paenibacillus contaminans]|uniref:Histidine phosphatase family protein n=1 Tax=Paenibacillus contaminans TaxID=450362 RepID=A0A329MPM1_9BACL|nr:histidine phosphatase family protein [Paenibacillus contaminans]RAV20673.1 histidine phosphatase family protein [Paenibacillus contaminans]